MTTHGGGCMRRREFIAGLILSFVPHYSAWAQARPPPRVGILVLDSRDREPFLKALRKGLSELGYVEGKNISLEYRSAGGDPSRLSEVANELVRVPVDIIVTWLTPAATAAKHATPSIPIVMVGAGDPVSTGLIESMGRPGGNLTGIAGGGPELAGKVSELIREFMPEARRVGLLLNGKDPFRIPLRELTEVAAGKAGIALHAASSGADDLEVAIGALVREGVDVVIAQPSLPQQRTVILAMLRRLPVVSFNRNFAEVGAIVSYSSKAESMFVDSARYVDLILKGAKPADLPVQRPKFFELLVNLKSAKTLGITVPSTLLIRADEVIE
jgi:putative tryptophan/tyrosine transport system substrate-binding protein